MGKLQIIFFLIFGYNHFIIGTQIHADGERLGFFASLRMTEKALKE